MKGQDQLVVYKLKKITIISLMFMAAQIAGGYYANSIAILADAFHLFSDVLAYVISLYAVLMTYKQSPKYLTFGYEKLQPFGALLNVAIIWIVTAELFLQATKRMYNKSIVQEPTFMLATSLFGLLCNLYIMKVLHSDEHSGHQCSHDHGHGHNHKTQHLCQDGHNHDHAVEQRCSHQELNELHVHSHDCSHQHKQEHEHEHEHQHDHQHQHQHHEHNHGHDHEHGHGHQKCGHNHQELKSQSPSNLNHVIINSHQNCSHSHQLHNKLADDDLKIGSDSSNQEMEPQKAYNRNINIEAAYIHILTDIILSIGVIISACTIYFFAPDGHVWSYWQLADPICTYLFSIMAIYSTISITKQAVVILLDGCDNPKMVSEIQQQLLHNPTVQQVESLKVWSMNRGKYYGGLRVKVHKGDHREIVNIFKSRHIEGFVELKQATVSLVISS